MKTKQKINHIFNPKSKDATFNELIKKLKKESYIATMSESNKTLLISWEDHN